jgi:hypothetical protein
MKNIIILSSTALLLLGCGGGGSSSDLNGTSGNNPNEVAKPKNGNESLIKDTVMVINTPYTVSQGDQILKSSDNALLRVTHVDGRTDSNVVLVEGSATIIVKK